MTSSLFSAEGLKGGVIAAASHTTIAEGKEPRIAEVTW
jgi:hypothetical protein